MNTPRFISCRRSVVNNRYTKRAVPRYRVGGFRFYSAPTNPLSIQAGKKYTWGKLPQFSDIEAQHVVPAVKETLNKLTDDVLVPLEKRAMGDLTWSGIIEPLEEIDLALEKVWGPVNHLLGVKNSEDFRKAHSEVLQEVVSFGLRVSQSKPIYEAIKFFRGVNDCTTLDDAQQRILEKRILSAELAGISLPPEKQQKFNEIQQKLSFLSKKFSDNVLDDTKKWGLDIDTAKDSSLASVAEGLPESLLFHASENWKKEYPSSTSTPSSGPWRFTLDGPSFVSFIENCRNRDLREKMYKRYMARASQGELSNKEGVIQILKLRQELSELLGFKDYSDISFSTKMANKAQVQDLLSYLGKASRNKAIQELNELREFSVKNNGPSDIKQWDVGFWAKRLEESKFSFEEEKLKKYFPLDNVLRGLFSLVEKIFGIKVQKYDDEILQIPKWNKDVQFYLVYNLEGTEPIAGFYLDPYSRPENKRGGAWMDVCATRRVTRRKSSHATLFPDEISSEVGKVCQIPVAYLVCNSTPPTDSQPSLLKFREVETLFHEFGHGLQHLLTKVPYYDGAGINGVEWDAVELPSQFMENWCYDRSTLKSISKHIETGEKLPDDMIQTLINFKNFRAASKMVRQLVFGTLDLEAHTNFIPKLSLQNSQKSESDQDYKVLQELQKEVIEKVDILPMLPEDNVLCSFSHIFAGGYSCGYYSYKYAEVLSADAFAAFEEVGLENSSEIQEKGRKFRDTVLAMGGGEHPAIVYRKFRGKDADPNSLLKQQGLTSS